MALKRIGPTVGNQGERKKVLKELDFVLECHEYEYVVKFYGVKFNNEPVSVETQGRQTRLSFSRSHSF